MDKLQDIAVAYKKGYRVSRIGLVTNPKGNKLGFGTISNTGYAKFSIKINGRTTKIFVHRFAAYRKYGKKIFDKRLQVRHINGKKTDNSANNLILGTPSENMMDLSKSLRLFKAIKASSKNRRFSDAQLAEMFSDRENGMRYCDLKQKYNVGKGTLSFIFNKSIYKNGGISNHFLKSQP